MSPFNNNQRLDNSSGIGQDNPNKAMQPASETKKTPWHLRFAPGAILRQIGLAVFAMTMLVGVQSSSVTAEIASVIDRWHWAGTTGHQYRLIDIVVFGIGTPYSGVYGSNNPKWKIQRVHPSTINLVRSRVKSINETCGDDLGKALKKYMGDIDAMTARAQRATAKCLIRNTNVKFPDCTLHYLSTMWEVEILFAIEELEVSVNEAVRRANSAVSAFVSSYGW